MTGRGQGGAGPSDRGGTLLEYAALLLLAVALVASLTTALPRVPEALRSAVDRTVDPGAAATGHDPGPDGDAPGMDADPRPDPLEVADTVRRCLPAPDPVGRVDCALAVLGLLESEVLEATVLQLRAEELAELFSSGSFSSAAAARAAVRLLWDHASDEAMRRLVRTETFGFLRPALDSPHLEYTLRFVTVSGDYVRAALERSAESPRRTPRRR